MPKGTKQEMFDRVVFSRVNTV